ncbi:MAG TPA: tetratricopeptide repeat protein [Thiolinea sp.]|nr:tetratricopeptide repeat protein [Thiolinea sp.]
MKPVTLLMIEIGFCALRLGAFTQAGKLFQIAAERHPEDAAGSIGLAMVALGQGQVDNALTLLEQGLEPARLNREEAEKLLLITYMLAGEDRKAGQLHQQLAHNSPHPASQEQHEQAGHFFNPALSAN